jgi:putative ABC transport system substrate-binding protein
MKRRDFIGLLGGAVAVPFAAHAQRDQGVRRIGVLQPFATDTPEKARVTAFVQELQRLGWTEGRNLQNRVSLGASRFAESGNGIGGAVAGRYPRQHHSGRK